jgi:hypothetical protein
VLQLSPVGVAAVGGYRLTDIFIFLVRPYSFGLTRARGRKLLVVGMFVRRVAEILSE